MKLIRTLLLAGIATGMCSTALYAADYYVLAATPGAVAGTPLAAISLQAGATVKQTRLQTNVNQRGNTAGKWVMVGQAPVTTSSTAAPSSLTRTSLATDTSAVTTAAALTAPAAGTTFNSFDALEQSGKLQGGDRVFLRAGYHGPLSVNDLDFATPVTIAGMPGETAHVESLNVLNSSNLVFRDLKVWAMSANAGSAALVRTYPGSNNITFANLDVRSTADAVNYLQWSLATWRANKRSGFLLDGDHISVIGNRVTGAYNTIIAQGKNALVENNIVDGFAGDGMRALGDFSTVRGNKIQNCHDTDATHDDGFQSYSRGANGSTGTSTVFNLTLENNKIYEWNASVPNVIPCKLQGIGMFDGMYENVVIRNNLVVVSHWHGITIAGGRKVVIANNTVVNPKGIKGNAPWIKIAPHKNGTPPTDVMVANNTVNWLDVNVNASRNVATANNVVVTQSNLEFTSVANRDFTLLPTAKSADAATAMYATPVDIAGVPRPKGKAPDVGAYESQ